MRGIEKPRLTERDRDELRKWVRAPDTPHYLARRAAVLLELEAGKSVKQIATELDVSRASVRSWCKRYREYGLEGLKDRERSGRPSRRDGSLAKRKDEREARESSFGDDRIVREILRLTIECIPGEASQWNATLLARYAGVSDWKVRQVWKSAGFRPDRFRLLKVSSSASLGQQVVDVMGLYMKPPEYVMVLGVDRSIGARDQDSLASTHRKAVSDLSLLRHDEQGVALLHMAYNIAAGQNGIVSEKHYSWNLDNFLRHIDKVTPDHVDLHAIVFIDGNAGVEDMVNDLASHDRFQSHWTYATTSWRNAVCGWMDYLERRASYWRAFSSVTVLRKEIERYVSDYQVKAAVPFIWKASGQAIMAGIYSARQGAGCEGLQ